MNAATDRASCPLQWRLFVPKAWDQDEERRRRARIPEEVRHVPKWQLALEIIDQLLEWGLPRRVVQADGGYGDTTAFRTGLEDRELEYVVQVKGGQTSAQPADAVPVAPDYRGRGRPPVPRYPEKATNLRDLVLAAGREMSCTIGWREGDRGPLASQFIAMRVRPANDAQRDDDGVLPERWLLAEWPNAKDEPVKYWLSNLPPETPLVTLVQLAKLRWRVEHDYRELKQCLGLDHYEGRSIGATGRRAARRLRTPSSLPGGGRDDVRRTVMGIARMGSRARGRSRSSGGQRKRSITATAPLAYLDAGDSPVRWRCSSGEESRANDPSARLPKSPGASQIPEATDSSAFTPAAACWASGERLAPPSRGLALRRRSTRATRGRMRMQAIARTVLGGDG